MLLSLIFFIDFDSSSNFEKQVKLIIYTKILYCFVGFKDILMGPLHLNYTSHSHITGAFVSHEEAEQMILTVFEDELLQYMD